LNLHHHINISVNHYGLGQRFFSLPLCPDQLWHPPPGVKWLGCEADHLSPLVLRLRIHGAIPPPPHLIGMVLT